MKKTITAIAVLLAVLLGSCAETGGGEAQNSAQSSAEATAQTEAVTKDAETSALEDPNAVTTDMVVPSETKPLSLEAALEKYEVYSGTVSEIDKLYGTLSDAALEGQPENDFVIHFTDADGTAFLASNGGSDGAAKITIRQIFCRGQQINAADGAEFGLRTEIILTDDITAIKTSSDGEYYIFNNDENVFISAGSGKDKSSYYLYAKDGSLKYLLQDKNYVISGGDPVMILSGVTSLDQWLSESGTVSIKDGKAVFDMENSKTYSDDGYVQKLFEDVHNNPDNYKNSSNAKQLEIIKNSKTIDEMINYNYEKEKNE